ncbi:carotenoid ester lipase precursor [Gymnopilus junonius]|uniref:Carboxylic ester hydrolase n=1 Tax=Gymnopilus junonius TaxID=109634 RepID=A0A9P5NIT7_GYMJU|nr:carotenoid ester lipase precursor [Gymnopilus junonius]
MKYFSTFFLLGAVVCAAPSASEPGTIVKLDYGSFQGIRGKNTSRDFRFPNPDLLNVGNLRFAPPQLPLPFTGVRQATSFGAACFQQASSFGGINTSVLEIIAPELATTAPFVASEDCLFINVVKPTNIPKGKKLPVLFWIYGDTSINPGNSLVARSVAIGEPIVYVSANYRLNAFGFLGGKEVKAAGLGNIGLRDQRFAMEWVQQHISAFGGDPTKVTIWGESAGAVSVGLHLVINNGNPEGLFHGAVMESGSPLGLSDTISQQPFFDQLVADTECTGSQDPIACLRAVPFEKLGAAINLSSNIFSFSSINIVWNPSVDGIVFQRNPQRSVQEGLYAKVPLITGDCDDEGTLFSLSTLNITTNAEFLAYMHSNYNFPSNRLAEVNQEYPEDLAQGSPFNTGNSNAITPEFKRLAAIQGDYFFQAPRRFFLQTASKTQKTFAFLFKRGKAQPILGSFHSSDIPEFYGVAGSSDFIATDALINFAHTGDPNLPKNPLSLLSKIEWPAWTVSPNPPLLTFLDPSPNVTITFDNYRVEPMQLLTSISLQIF